MERGYLANDLLILISVAPLAPYPHLYTVGPKRTWMAQTVPGVTVIPFSGQPLGRWRKNTADLREMLRFAGAATNQIGTVNSDARLMQAYDKIRSGFLGALADKFFRLSSRLITFIERYILSPIKNRRLRKVSENQLGLKVESPSTIANSLINQISVIDYLASGPQIRGVLFLTSSAYLELARFDTWEKLHNSGGVVFGGSNALEANGGLGRPFLSGFAQYFSWEAIRLLAKTSSFDHSLPNDEALTKWILKHRYSWINPGIEWSMAEEPDGECPLCAHGTVTIVRCTVHGDRDKEAKLMQRLNHIHHGLG